MRGIKEGYRNFLDGNKKILYINAIINIVLLGIAIGINNIAETPWFVSFAILSLIQLGVNWGSLLMLGEKFVSLTSIFLVFTYVFHYGHLILHALGIPLPKNTSYAVYKIVGSEVYRQSCIFVMIITWMVTLGMILVWIISNERNRKIQAPIKSRKQIEIDLAKLRIVGIIMILIGIIPLLYIDISKLMLYIEGSYLNTYEIATRGYVSAIAAFANVGVLILVIGCHKNKKLASGIVFVTIAYKLIIILTGNRGPAIVYIIALLIIWASMVVKLKFRTYIILFVLAYFGIVLITFVAHVRNAENQDFMYYVASFVSAFRKNPLILVLAEFGSTLLSIGYVLMFVPTVIPYTFGSNYIQSLLTVFPNVGGFLNDINANVMYATSIMDAAQDGRGLGGSYIGELYYSFGPFGIFFAILIGVLIGYMSYKLYKCFEDKKFIPMAFIVIALPSVIWWVRDYFGTMVRGYIWEAVAIAMILFVLNKIWPKIEGWKIVGVRKKEGYVD